MKIESLHKVSKFEASEVILPSRGPMEQVKPSDCFSYCCYFCST